MLGYENIIFGEGEGEGRHMNSQWGHCVMALSHSRLH